MCISAAWSGQDAIEASEDAVFAKDFDELVKAGPDGFAGAGEANRMDEQTGFDGKPRGDLLETGFKRRRIEFSDTCKSIANFGKARLGFGRKFLQRPGRIREVVHEVKVSEGRHFGEQFYFLAASIER